MNKQLSLLACIATYFVSMLANDINPQLSMILSPNNKQMVTSRYPLIIGSIIKNNGKPKKNQIVTIYIDGIPYANVATNKSGLFTYQVRSDKPLTNGQHFVFAVTKDNTSTYIRGSSFTVEARTQEIHEMYKSGNADATNSYIAYPFTGAATSTSTPYIITIMNDSSNHPVGGEHVTYKVDSSTVTSNCCASQSSNGMSSYTLTGGQALSDGVHTVDAHAVESNIDLAQQTFTVDTTPPSAPTITSPTNNQTVTSSTVIVTGTTEANALVTVYMDNDFGDIAIADENGDWSIEYDDMSNGQHIFNATTTDEANNTGSFSPTIVFFVNA